MSLLDCSHYVRPTGINHQSWTFTAPPHWQRKRLRSLCKVNPSAATKLRTMAGSTEVSFLPMELARAGSPELAPRTAALSDVRNGFTPFIDGDLLIAKITPCFENGKGGIADNLLNGIGFGSTEFHVLRPGPEIDVRFLYYATISEPFREIGVRMMRGSAGQQRVPVEFLNDFVMVFPDIRTQRLIAEFLDRYMRLTGSLIRAKRREIELLNEQKQAIIGRAITRGLDPNVRLKPSDVEWLGDVPEHWAVVRCWEAFSQRVERGHLAEQLLSVTISHGVVRQDELLKITAKKDSSNQDRSNYKLVHIGDIAYNKMRMWQGAVGRSDYRGNVSPAYVVVHPRNHDMANVSYYHYMFRTTAFMCESYKHSYGICDDQLSLRYEDFKTIQIPMPPRGEQDRIARFLQHADEHADQLITVKRTQINLLREYRTRLIADVVTGKLDVRGVELPDLEDADMADDRGDSGFDSDADQDDLPDAEEVEADDED